LRGPVLLFLPASHRVQAGAYVRAGVEVWVRAGAYARAGVEVWAQAGAYVGVRVGVWAQARHFAHRQD
jgi:hypothetical protein